MSSEQNLEPTIARLQAIDGYDFEDFVADFFSEDGWDATVTQDSQDGGIDVIAEQMSPFHQRAVIQAKSNSPDNKVGRPEIQQYSALLREDNQNDMAVVVTTSAFTRGAYDYGREHNVKLIDGAAIAGFIIARERHDLLDEYAPHVDELEFTPEDIFPVQEGPRSRYYEERPMEFATKAFEHHSMLDALEMIQENRIGRVLVESLGQLKEAIDENEDDAPIETLLSSPRILNQHWFDVETSDEISDAINSMADLSGNPPNDGGVVCYKDNSSVTVCLILPPAHAIERRDLAYIEDCVDFIAGAQDFDGNDMSGLVVGGDVDCRRGSHSKYGRLTSRNFDVETYSNLLERSVNSNRELLQAIRPYLQASEDEEMLAKLDSLQRVVR